MLAKLCLPLPASHLYRTTSLHYITSPCLFYFHRLFLLLFVGVSTWFSVRNCLPSTANELQDKLKFCLAFSTSAIIPILYLRKFPFRTRSSSPHIASHRIDRRDLCAS